MKGNLRSQARTKINQKINFYDIAEKDKRESLGYYEEKIRFILEEVGENKTVLDVGCHDGFIGEMLLKKKNKVFGVDIVKKSLEIARQRGLIVKLIDVERERLPFPEDYFDVVILGDILEHVFDTDRLLKQCKRVLKGGGKLFVTTPNVASFGRRLMLLLGINPFLEYSLNLPAAGAPPVGHIRYYTVETLRNQLEYNGFQVSKIRGSALNLFFFRTHFLTNVWPSLCTMLMCLALKK